MSGFSKACVVGDSWGRKTSELFPFSAQGAFEKLPGPSLNLSAQGSPSLPCQLEGQSLHPELLTQL